MGPLHNWLLGWFDTHASGALSLSDKGASNLASVGSSASFWAGSAAPVC
jgi:hypothetical protein